MPLGQEIGRLMFSKAESYVFLYYMLENTNLIDGPFSSVVEMRS